MRSVLQDLRHGLRLMRRSPGVSLVAVAALAIGIAATTTIFSVLDTLLVRPLPYRDADRLAIVWEHNLPRDRQRNVVSPGNFIHWRERARSFEDLAAAGLTFGTTLSGAGEPEQLQMQLVTASLFPVLGVPPALGRTFATGENQPGSRVTVISDRLWRRRFAGNPATVGSSITLDGRPFEVVGVMPPGFSFLDRTVDVWLPVAFTAESRTPRGRWMYVIGRLAPGVDVAAAQQDMTGVAARLTELFPDFDTGWTARVVPLRDELTGDARPALLVLSGVVGLVLLIACANIANLLLARATVRHRELAVRAALGASRGRLVRQMLTESAVLAGAGGAAGIVLTWWAVRVLRVTVASTLPIQRLDDVAMDGRVVAFAVLAALASALLFGGLPALAGARSGQAGLKDGGRAGTAASGTRVRAGLVVAEMAIAVVLLAGAGLLLRSFIRLTDVDPGFTASHAVSMRVSLPDTRYGEDSARAGFLTELFDRVEAMPGITAAGAVSFLPLSGPASATRFTVLDRPAPRPGEEPVTEVRVIAREYFAAMGIPLLRGRLFDSRDAGSGVHHVIVNAALAQRYWPDADPIGRRIRVSWGDDVEDEIVGVVGNVRHQALQTEPRPAIYWPYLRNAYGTMSIVVRTDGPVEPVVAGVRRFVGERDPLLAVADIRRLGDVVSDSVARERLLLLLLGFFAAAAVLLAAVGIYGVMAFAVTERTREIGIRLALGAQPAQVLGLVVRQGLGLAVGGAAAGAIGALLLTRLMAGLLFDTSPADAPTFAAVAGLLIAVAAAGSYLPARRASRVDPVVALRSE